MFVEFYYLLRDAHIPVSITEFLSFIEALSKGLIRTPTDLYYTSRAILVKTREDYDRFDECWSFYFKDAQVPETIRDEIFQWLQSPSGGKEELLEQLQKLGVNFTQEELDEFEGYDFETLQKILKERMEEQVEQHEGGDYWIGTGGTSPLGWGGYHPGGLRIGGIGGGGSASKIASKRIFRDYRSDRILNTRQIEVALKKLKKLSKIGAPNVLNIEETIDKTCKNGGEIELVLEKQKKNNLKIMLLMDVGGSMDSYTRLVEELFSAANRANHFKQFKHYYFHNCLYENLFLDAAFNEPIPINDVFRKFKSDFRVIIVGDASMGPWELFAQYGAIDYFQMNQTSGYQWLLFWKDHFPHTVWMNPEHPGAWQSRSREEISKIFPMHHLTLEGLDKAIKELI